jgi:predicted Zn-dependent protease
MSAIHPGLSNGYLESATVFWDYFQFDDALAHIQAARKRFANAELYGYQAGALYEDKRDYPHAIAEYVADSADPDAHARLLTLAGRPQFAAMVDEASANAVTSDPDIETLQLRVDVLHALHQPSGIAPTVEAAIAQASTFTSAEELAAFSQSQQLAPAYQSALQREIALAGDPVQRIEIQYELVRALVDHKDIAGAQRIIDSVHAGNPKLIGVVRTTTDFYWNNKQPQRAVATLLQAAREANPTLAHDYTLEAIEKSNQSNDFSGARTLLHPLLSAEPFNPQYLSLQAESYSLAHDDAGVRDLYTATIEALQHTTMPATERRDTIALARQGLIPALTGLKDFAGGMDQQIALIRAFPQDDTTLDNAVAYARLHSREVQLVSFLNQAVSESPRDARFAMDLGRVDVEFEDDTGALAAYSKAIAIRADRPDLFIARADLEERAQAFDAACSDYQRLYTLSYNDPQWMQKTALLRARQGKPDLAVKALQTAWIDGRPASAQNEFRVAQQLEAWNLLSQAEVFARQGAELAGNDLLANAANSDGAILYARLLARERKSSEAFTLLNKGLAASHTSPSAPSVILQQVQKQGLASVTDSDWRAALVASRLAQAQTTYRDAVQAIASVVAEFYTPEEKAGFATLLDTQHAGRPDREVIDLWIPAAQTAGLQDTEAAWQRAILLGGGRLAGSQLDAYDALETARMDTRTLAETLDSYAQKVNETKQVTALTRAVTAWHNAGDTQREALDIRKLVLAHQQEYDARRLFALYLADDTPALLALTTQADTLADAAANYILANGTRAQAYLALGNRSAARTAVWASANTALLGLYYGDGAAKTNTAFQSTLGDLTIGHMLAAKPDPNTQLIGKPWFYYAGRYGLFLTLSPQPAQNSEDYLPAILENAPSDAASFSALAQTYLSANKVDAAIAEYRHAIELDPSDPSPDISIAEALCSSQRHDQAIAEWTAALTKLRARVDLRQVPESFWNDFAAVADDARKNAIGAQLKPAMTSVLASYIQKNGTYRSTELLHSAYTALAKPDSPSANADTAATNWLVALITAAPADQQLAMLSALTNANEYSGDNWIPGAQLGPIYRAEIARAQAQKPDASSGSANSTLDQLILYKTQYIQWLLKNDRAPEAQQLLDSIPPSQRKNSDLQSVTILLAAKQSGIPALLAGYQLDPANAPDLTVVNSAANTLRLQHDPADSRLLLEYVFQQKLAQQSLTAPDYLSLAEARIANNDLPGAIDLLNRLALRGDFYDNLDSAASLLERTGHSADALPLLAKLANGTPWNAQYQVRLARAQLALRQPGAASSKLSAIASSEQAPYAARAAAALALHTIATTAHFGSEELTLLATANPTPQQADQPYFLDARIAAAAAAPIQQRVVLLRAAIAVAPAPALDWLRLQLFQAELALRHYQQAGVAVAPILTNDAALFSSATQEVTDAATKPPVDAPYQIASAFSTTQQQLDFLLALATMEEHLDDQQQAITHLQSALQLTTDPSAASRLTLRIQSLQSDLDRVEKNADRRPVLSPSVEQPNTVQPRLIADANSSDLNTEAHP